MNLARFKLLHERFSKFPLSREEWDSPEYEEYYDAIDEDKACGEYYLKAQLENKNPYQNYCCLKMAYHLAIPGNREDVDQIIDRFVKTKEFGIPIHDGGSSHVQINFCPWCGTKPSTLPQTLSIDIVKTIKNQDN